MYPALLPLMRTSRLPVVDWTDAAHRWFKWTRPFRRKTKSCFLYVCHHISTGLYTSTCFVPKYSQLLHSYLSKEPTHTKILTNSVIPEISFKSSVFFLPAQIRIRYTGLFKIIVGVQLSSGNSAPNSGNKPPSDISIRRWYAQFQETGCVCYPGTEGTNQNRHWNHHRWHATNSLERNRLSCCCL